MEKDSNYNKGYEDGANTEYRRHIKEFDDLTVSYEKHIDRLVATIKEKDNAIAELNSALEKLEKENEMLRRMKIPARKNIDIQKVFDLYVRHNSVNKIATAMAVSPHTVIARLRELGIYRGK